MTGPDSAFDMYCVEVESWLVVGGAGYIGAHVTRHLLGAGYEVQVLDNLSTGLKTRLPRGVMLHDFDVRDTLKLRELVQDLNLQGVVYLAGLKQARESMSMPIEYWDVNVGGILSTVSALRGSSVKYFMFSSSCSIFGDATAVTETSSANPQSVYATTKYVSEKILNDCLNQLGISYAVLRYFNVIGNGDFPDSTDRASQSLIPRMASLIQKNLPVEIYGSSMPTPDGTCLRDYIDVRDIAAAHVLVADKLKSSENPPDLLAYNLGSERPISVLSMVRALSEAIGCETQIEFKPGNLADPAAVWSDSSKARAELKWLPKFSVEESLRAHVAHSLQ
jgi:UDP-glucose-4-epimerase GalE